MLPRGILLSKQDDLDAGLLNNKLKFMNNMCVRIGRTSQINESQWILYTGTAGHILNNIKHFQKNSMQNWSMNMVGFNGHKNLCSKKEKAILNSNFGLN